MVALWHLLAFCFEWCLLAFSTQQQAQTSAMKMSDLKLIKFYLFFNMQHASNMQPCGCDNGLLLIINRFFK